MGLGLEEQVAQFIGRVGTVFFLPADGHIEADGEAGEVFGAVGVAEVDQLVEFEPEALGDLKGILQCHAGLAAGFIVWVEILIHPSGREGGGIALHLQDDVEEPSGLNGLLIGLRWIQSQLLADAGHFQEVLLVGFMVKMFRQLGVAVHENGRALHGDDDALVEIPLLAFCFFHMGLGFHADACRAKAQPFFRTRADVALGVILLVDLYHLGDGVHLGTHRCADLVLEGSAFPIRQDLLPEFFNVLLPDLEAVLRPGRQGLKLPVHPGGAGLGEHHAATDTRGAVANDTLVRLDADGDPGQGGL